MAGGLDDVSTGINPCYADAPTLEDLAQGMGSLYQVLKGKMSPPMPEELARGEALHARALKGGLTYADVQSESIWAGIIGLFGAVERLQKAIAPYEPNHKVKNENETAKPA